MTIYFTGLSLGSIGGRAFLGLGAIVLVDGRIVGAQWAACDGGVVVNTVAAPQPEPQR